MMQSLDSQCYKQNSASMLKVPNCERDSLKSYGLNQQKASNIGVVESVRSKTQVLAYQLEQGGHFIVAKEELQA
jgi:hypothetical protein